MKKTVKYFLFFLLSLLLIFIGIGILNSSKIKKGALNFTNDWQGKIININGENIRYIQEGKGKDVLLIHGTPGSIEDWNPLINKLKNNYRVTVFDRLGNGFSTANNYKYTLSENTNFVTTFINKLNLSDVVIVGHSYGGSIATKLATQKNDKIKSFVVIASPLYQFNNSFDHKLLASPLIGKGIAILIAKFAAKPMIETGLKKAFGEEISSGFLKTRIQLWSQSKVLYTTSNERKNYEDDLLESSKNYKNITKKITFFVGLKDNKNIIEDFNQTKKDIKQAQNISFNDVSHYIQFEKTNEILTIVEEHLNQN